MNETIGMDNPGLDVYLWDQKVGRLWLDEKRRFVFQYESEWIHQKGAVPLSLSLHEGVSKAFTNKKYSGRFPSLIH
ncbi:MAG: hypothetical protein A4E72_00670 [Syntrophus sp. PtaU1.Bin208]|nr:MAG: hypothetical protein A4E72_00670 [Syntrophus sp. PtaU1.Bin208]